MLETFESLPVNNLIFQNNINSIIISATDIKQILYFDEVNIYEIFLYQTLPYKTINFIQNDDVYLIYNNIRINFKFEKLGISINNFIQQDYPYWKLILLKK